MKRIPWAYIVKFSNALEEIDKEAKIKLNAFLKQVDLSDPERAREHIAEIMERVVGASDAVASSMAAGFYDGIREYQTGEKLGALADSGREPDSTKSATYGITSRLAKAEEPDISLVEGLLMQRIGYEIQRSVGRTMYRNGQRDPNKPKFARVPLGGDSCEFCRMLASRGFAYNSERSAGKLDPDHYHDGCRCRVVCSWEKDPIIDGMSEEDYNDRAYGEHRDAYRSWASKDHSQHQEHQKKKRRNRYTDDGKLRAGYSGERIDKQADYTEADRKKVAAAANIKRQKAYDNLKWGKGESSAKAASDLNITVTDVQFGKKIGKHAQDWGLDASKESDRAKMRAIVDDIINNADEVAKGSWRGQTGACDFFIKEDDVVVVSASGEFVTVLKGGANNARVKSARNLG